MKKKITGIQSIITYWYLFFMLGFFLLYYHNFYFDITESKFKYFAVSTMMLFIGAVLLCFLSFVHHIRINKKLPHKASIKEKMQRMISDCSISDAAMLLFLLFNLLSACLSRYGLEAFTGSTGRYMGWFGLSLLCFSYYYISRHYRRETSIFYIFILCSSLVFLLAIANFFNFDPLGFRNGVSYAQIKPFLSTIGNMNFLASLICLSVPVTVVFYTYSHHRAAWMYHLPLALAFGALTAANSDSGYLGLGVATAAFLIYAVSDLHKTKRILLVILNFLCTSKLFYLICRTYETHCRGLEALSLDISSSNVLYAVIVLILLLYLFLVKREAWLPIRWNPKKIRVLLLCLFGMLVLSGVISFCYFTFINRTAALGRWEHYLRFQDAWGSSRGLIWRMATEDYGQYSLLQKLFGCGPDTIRSLMTETFGAHFNIWDNCHNEYLQYLMTGGMCTALSYTVLLISSFYRQWKHKGDMMQFAVSASLFSYAVQALVNVNQPFTTPVFFILLGMAEAYLRKNKQQQQESLLTGQE